MRTHVPSQSEGSRLAQQDFGGLESLKVRQKAAESGKKVHLIEMDLFYLFSAVSAVVSSVFSSVVSVATSSVFSVTDAASSVTSSTTFSFA